MLTCIAINAKVREVGIEGIKISEANYPENLRKTIIINGKFSVPP